LAVAVLGAAAEVEGSGSVGKVEVGGFVVTQIPASAASYADGIADWEVMTMIGGIPVWKRFHQVSWAEALSLFKGWLKLQEVQQ
jgi:hypothetical protein